MDFAMAPARVPEMDRMLDSVMVSGKALLMVPATDLTLDYAKVSAMACLMVLVMVPWLVELKALAMVCLKVAATDQKLDSVLARATVPSMVRMLDPVSDFATDQRTVSLSGSPLVAVMAHARVAWTALLLAISMVLSMVVMWALH